MIAPAVDVALRRHPSLFACFGWWFGAFFVTAWRCPTATETALVSTLSLVQWIHWKLVTWWWRDHAEE